MSEADEVAANLPLPPKGATLHEARAIVRRHMIGESETVIDNVAEALLARKRTKEPGVARVATYIDQRLELDRKAIADWAAQLEKNPAYALEWASKLFDIAARIAVWTKVRQWCDAESVTTVGTMHYEAQRIALQKATLLARSTSVTSNAMEDAIRAAWAEAVAPMGLLGPAGPGAL